MGPEDGPAGRPQGRQGPRASVVVAAHDEALVIERCLAALARQDERIDVTVVANGCHDDTAERARTSGVRVVELAEAGKSNALNHGDAVAQGFPRLYLDADIVLPPDALRLLADAVDEDGAVHAAVPARRLAVGGRPWPVRCWASINQRLPVYDHALFGRGAIMLSGSGRRLFEDFPGVVADDLYLDSVVDPARRRLVRDVEVVVETPFSTEELLRRLVRVRRGNADLRSGTVGARSADRWSWLRSVVREEPRLLPAGLVYAAITLTAALLGKLQPSDAPWGRDESSRSAVGRLGASG